MQQIKVRAEVGDDFNAIDVVNLSAFQGEAEAQLVGDLRKSAGFIPDLSLVAELNGRIVGHVVLSRVQLKSGDKKKEILASPRSRTPVHADCRPALVRFAEEPSTVGSRGKDRK